MRGSGTRCDNTGLAFGYSEKTDYLYCGKEWLEFFGIDWYDSKSRYLNTSGIFTSIDPLAEKYPGISPYAYCAGNPVNSIDANGSDPIYASSLFGRIKHIGDEERRLYRPWLYSY